MKVWVAQRFGPGGDFEDVRVFETLAAAQAAHQAPRGWMERNGSWLNEGGGLGELPTSVPSIEISEREVE